ncbi:TRAP transporter permease [Dialister sp.]|uniref:TRAP transporter permease n=1 Tax=Dialister sp. TaxID=1955814 RepID=UPI002E81B427|nr:TRAP transporter permease [Dialister sp.]MEE3452624.1 TRAP transporter permease [Dialister sp.]
MADLEKKETGAGAPPAEGELSEDLQAKLKALDKESNTADYTGICGTIISIICICFSLFQIYTGIFGARDAMIQRCIHLSFGICLVFLLCPTKKSWIKNGRFNPLDVILAILAMIPPIYILVNYQALILRAGTVTPTDAIIGTLGMLMVLEAARRIVGLPIVIVVVCFLAYGFLGPYMPGPLAHRGLTINQMVGHIFFTTEGVFGIPLGVSSTFIFLFILFGAYLEKTGLGKFFIDIANAIAGWASGGPAKVAVISSALQGTISGSSVANVVGSGSFTIPMMKKLGYHKNFAGAVEAAASTGGQLMPPIMGAAAFLMAEFVGVPYMEVVKAAVVPAILYFLGVFLGVHFEAKKNNLKGTPRSQLPPWGEIMKEEGHLAIPLIAIIGLLASGYTPMKAALAGIFISILTAMLRKNTRMSIPDIVDGLVKGARGALGVIIACASAGMIIGIVTKTGVGLKLASALVTVAAGNFMLLLVCTMLTSLILGMGVPTTANYVITSTIAAPALIQLGVPILAAHMFVFYFGIIADITPPVALAAYAGSAISGGDPLKTGVNASKLGIAAFIIPYVFVLSPSILGIGATFLNVTFTTITALIGMTGISGAMIGQFYTKANPLERLILLAGGLCLIDPHTLTDIIGIAILAGIFALQYFRAKKAKAAEG